MAFDGTAGDVNVDGSAVSLPNEADGFVSVDLTDGTYDSPNSRGEGHIDVLRAVDGFGGSGGSGDPSGSGGSSGSGGG